VKAPPYPKEALAEKVEGLVLARCVVEPGGSLSGCVVLKAPYSFEAPVKAWLSGAHARPFTASGKPVRVPCNFRFNYKIDP
jgi:outer membrane biosynthesis protein TonB